MSITWQGFISSTSALRPASGWHNWLRRTSPFAVLLLIRSQCSSERRRIQQDAQILHVRDCLVPSLHFPLMVCQKTTVLLMNAKELLDVFCPTTESVNVLLSTAHLLIFFVHIGVACGFSSDHCHLRSRLCLSIAPPITDCLVPEKCVVPFFAFSIAFSDIYSGERLSIQRHSRFSVSISKLAA